MSGSEVALFKFLQIRDVSGNADIPVSKPSDNPEIKDCTKFLSGWFSSSLSSAAILIGVDALKSWRLAFCHCLADSLVLCVLADLIEDFLM
ncbi:hypothetical protein CI610_02803 [invertebrate metagenome]|uniref:Uncharacterized protein n=1 Tax=invertebrate metagenome TaxID=1711999 RepID=A0A2H9T4X7_9ZZZZ